MKFLFFRKGSFAKWGDESLGYSRSCIIEFQKETVFFTNRELTSPVDVGITEERVSVSIQLLNFDIVKNLIEQIGQAKKLEIEGEIIGKGIDNPRPGTVVKFTVNNACLSSIRQLNLSEGAFPEVNFVGLYDKNTGKLYDITYNQ